MIISVHVYPFCPCSSHPYLFFNNDGHSMTFVGFQIMPNEDLVDPGRRATQVGNAGVSAVGPHGGLGQDYQYSGQGMVNQAQYVMQYMEGQGWGYQYPEQGLEGHYSGQTTRQIGRIHSSMPAQIRETATQCIIERNIMNSELFRELKNNGVDFNEDYRTWNKLGKPLFACSWYIIFGSIISEIRCCKKLLL